MKFQPCNPSFIQARDAILLADKIIHQERYKCDIFKGFAKRGLGIGANDQFENHFDIPKECN